MMRRVFLQGLLATMSIGTALASPTGTAGLDYPSAWMCDQSKFNWYCDVEPVPPDEQQSRPIETRKAKTREEDALERLEAWQRDLKAKRAISILEPTPENVKAYIEAQEQLTQTASLYSDVWRRVVWQNPELNYELKRPANNAAISTYTSNRKSAEKRTLDELNKEWGIFFFFRSDCPYCHRISPTLKFLSDTYGITVFPVSVDGGVLPEFPNPQRDNGMVEKLGIHQVPMLVLGNIKDKRLIPLSSGVISAQDVIERIYVLTSTRPGELY